MFYRLIFFTDLFSRFLYHRYTLSNKNFLYKFLLVCFSSVCIMFQLSCLNLFRLLTFHPMTVLYIFIYIHSILCQKQYPSTPIFCGCLHKKHKNKKHMSHGINSNDPHTKHFLKDIIMHMCIKYIISVYEIISTTLKNVWSTKKQLKHDGALLSMKHETYYFHTLQKVFLKVSTVF